MLKQLFVSSKRILFSPEIGVPSRSLRNAASAAVPKAVEDAAFAAVPKTVEDAAFAAVPKKAETESQGDDTKDTAKTKEAKPKKPLPARRLEYKTPPRDLLFGIHPIEIALAEKRRKFYKLYVKPDRVVPHTPELQNIVQWATNLEIPVIFKSREVLSDITKDAVHQGVVLQASRLKLNEWSQQLEIFGKTDEDGKLLVYMDRITDPMNMGAVIRSCVVMGVDAILVPSENSCRLSSVVSKASSGALECATICTVEDDQEFFNFVKKLGWEILGTDSDCLPYDRCEASTRNRLLVLGNENHGVNEDLVKFFTKTVSVPSVTNRIGSLNVSVTAGILLSHFAKHKRFT